MIPPLPQGQPSLFRTTVHGTIFAARASQVDVVHEGESLLLIPDPPGQDDPAVWVHRSGGDTVGHLPPEINGWLAPWLLKGGAARATVLKVRGPEEPSWRRLLIEVRCAA
jgi:hypothetical protein